MMGPFQPTTNLREPRQYIPVDAPVRNDASARSPDTLRAVAAQFDVESNPRYQRTATSTFCNIAVWDMTRALGAEVPHWIEDKTVVKGWRELNVNATLEWMEIAGGASGWNEVDGAEAARRADAGFPTIVMWKNPGGHGHIALCLPSKGNGIRIAQAGAHNYFDVPLVSGFPPRCSPLRYFTHA